jgi:hypothetical protein
MLRDEWLPRLFQSGFVGDGERFLRRTGEVIHAIGLQEAKGGGSCCVNLGLHLAFLPLTTNVVPEPGDLVRAESCEFQWRLTPAGYSDYWWAWEQGAAAHLPLSMLAGAHSSPLDAAYHLVETWVEHGEPALARLSSPHQVAGHVTIDALDVRGTDGRVVPEYAFTPGRAALTMARIQRHLGHEEMARRFAQAGLERAGKARAVRAALEQFLADPGDVGR